MGIKELRDQFGDFVGRPSNTSSQPHVCQHCWSRAATTSNPNLCGECNVEWLYYLTYAHTPVPLTQAACKRAEQEIPR